MDVNSFLERTTNCPNCGSSFSSVNSKCPYCGTMNTDRMVVDQSQPVTMTLKTLDGTELTFALLIDSIDIGMHCDTDTIYADSMVYKTIRSPRYSVDISGSMVKMPGDVFYAVNKGASK